MALHLYNTYTHNKDPFEPLTDREVRIYSCGPTVWDRAHLGNFRSFIFADVLRRTLEFLGYRVRLVMNVTDVGHFTSDDQEVDVGEDRMMKGARREGKHPLEIAREYTEAFVRDAEVLNVRLPDVLAPATEHVPVMVDLLRRIEARGHAYRIPAGLYFDVRSVLGYGRLSRQDLDQQKAGARVEVVEGKRHPADFALWRATEPAALLVWDSPWGPGIPGWHIECSAMSMHYLGERFDIHTGGADHIPIHHENEIAQNIAATGDRGARWWMHGEFMLVDGRRMGKSEGNAYTVDDLAARGIEPLLFRYYALGTHYRAKLNFTWDGIEAAQTALSRLREAAQRHRGAAGRADRDYDAVRQQFRAELDDDLNTSRALAVAWDVARGDPDPAAFQVLMEFDRVLGLDLDREPQEVEVPLEVRRLVEEREAARRAREYVKADQLRAKVAGLGYAIEDMKEGPRVRKS